jgi:hypothetical protein
MGQLGVLCKENNMEEISKVRRITGEIARLDGIIAEMDALKIK